MKKVGFGGLGIMGGGMAANLVRKGFEVTVWNRDVTKSAPLTEMGAKVANSPAEMAAEAEVVVTMLRDDAAVRAVLSGPQGAFQSARPGTTFVEMSTVTPSLVQAMVEEAKAHGHSYLDVPVTGSKDAAAGGKLNLLVGGPAEVLEAQRDVLEAISQSITHLGPNGASAYFKLANNQFAAVMLAALGESLAMVEQAGLNREQALEIFVGTASRVCGLKQNKIKNEEWSTDFALEMMLKDMTQSMSAAQELKLPMPIVAAAREVYLRGCQIGLGEVDFAAVTEVARKKD